jgi:hypothetical protein
VVRPKQLPRLTRSDVEDLHRACAQIDAAAAVLVQSTWQGKFPVLTMLEQVKQTIAGLYNRSEENYFAQLEAARKRAPWGRRESEPTGGSSSSAPDAAPGSLEA